MQAAALSACSTELRCRAGERKVPRGSLTDPGEPPGARRGRAPTPRHGGRRGAGPLTVPGGGRWTPRAPRPDPHMSGSARCLSWGVSPHLTKLRGFFIFIKWDYNVY